jgi:hypothetical protein
VDFVALVCAASVLLAPGSGIAIDGSNAASIRPDGGVPDSRNPGAASGAHNLQRQLVMAAPAPRSAALLEVHMRTCFCAAAATIFVVAAVVTLGPVSGHADAAILLHVSPRVATEPATLTIRATVEQHADNRGLQVRILSSGYCRSSVVQLDGLDAPRTTTLTYPEIPGGAYEIQTTVLGPGGKTRARASEEIKILSKFGG